MSQYAASMFALAAECVKVGLPVRYELLAGSAVTRGRNKLVAQFLADTSLTHLFFVDGDVGFEATAFFRLLLADLDLVAGVYPLKAFNWPAEGLAQGTTEQEFDVRYTAYPFNPLETGTLAVNRDGFGEISEAPTGFMCIKRHVFDKMRAAYPERQCAPDRGDDPSIHGLYWTFFEDLIEPKTRRLLTEDYAFCHLWRKIGGKVFIDIDSKFSHQGQHVWQGDLAKHLETKRVR